MSILAKDLMMMARKVSQGYAAGHSVTVHGVSFPKKPWAGKCAGLARRFWSAWHKGQKMRFAGVDFDGDGDVDALDLMKYMVAEGYASQPRDDKSAWAIALATGKVKPGALVFSDRGANGHVVTLLDPNKPDWRVIPVLENTTSRLRGPGTVMTTLGRVFRNEWEMDAVGYYDPK